MKKVFALLLSVAMVICMMPSMAFAATISTIDEITIRTPIAGAEPQETIEVANEKGYTVDIAWKDSNDKAVGADEDQKTFEKDAVYTATVILKPIEGNTLTATAVEVNTKEKTLSAGDVEGTLTCTYEFPAAKAIKENGLEITTQPTKKAYVEGQSFDPAGMVVKVTYDDNTTVDEAFTEYIIVDGTSLTKDVTSVTIKAGDKTVTQPITVEEKKIASIAVTGPTKTDYVIGDELDTTGLVVTATYNDGTTKVLTSDEYAITGFDSSAYAATQAVTVKATANEEATDTFTVKIDKKTLTKDNFNITGLTQTYDGEEKAVTVEAKAGVGAGTVTVKYDNATTVPSDAGTYTVTFDVAESDTCKSATGLSAGTLTIEKATAPVTVINVTAKASAEKEVTLTGIPENAGNPSCNVTSANVTDDDSILAADIDYTIADGKLTVKMGAVSVEAGKTKTATIPVTVTSDNYDEFTINVVVTLIANDATEAIYNVTCDNIDVTYGETITLTGKVTATVGAEAAVTLDGKWAFDDAAPVNVADSGADKAVTFTPDAKYEGKYAEAHTTISVAIKQAEPTVTVADFIANGTTTLADVTYSVAGVKDGDNVEGELTWTEDKTTPVVADTEYTWTFTPKNEGVSANYKAVTGTKTAGKASTPTPGGGGVIVTDPLPTAKNEATNAVQNYVKPADYEEAEAAEIKAIMDKAAADIKNAKTAEEVKAIEAAAKEAIDKIDTAEEKAVIRTVEATKFRATSKRTTLNGKKAIKITWNKPEGVDFDGYDIYRSTKQFSGFGKTPFFTTTKQTYTNNKGLEVGKTYYYKVRAFKYVNGRKVYSEYSYKAIRTMK